jgi:radical SAM protein with 4Fe4S-binding SPASM domain
MQYPKRVTIELTNRCNRRCEGCPRHKMTYPQGDMSLTLLTDITQQLPSNVTVVPFFRGEPTLHPHFTEAMQLFSKFGTVQLASNGDNLTTANQKAIIDNCTFVSLSLHRFKYPNQTHWLSFLYDCLGAKVETQVSIIDSLLDHRKRHWKRQWLKYVDHVRVYQTHSVNGFGNMCLPLTAQSCSKPFEDMVVYWDGKVGLCNHDWNNQTVLGDLNMQSIEEVWESVNYQTVRAKHQTGMRVQVPSCIACNFNSNQIYGEKT